jgi:hypothetical protein
VTRKCSGHLFSRQGHAVAAMRRRCVSRRRNQPHLSDTLKGSYLCFYLNLFPVHFAAKWIMDSARTHATPCNHETPCKHDTAACTSLTRRTTHLPGCGHRCDSQHTQSPLVASAFGVPGEENISAFGTLCHQPCTATTALRWMAIAMAIAITAAKLRLSSQLALWQGRKAPP